MSLLSVYFRQSKMIHLVKFFKENSRLTSYHGNHLISWRNGATSSICGISSPVRQSQNPASFVFFQLPCDKRELSVVSWVRRIQRNVKRRHTVRWCLMKTFGHCRTLVSGQAVDTCCQELNGTPPSSRDIRSEGQLHQYSLLTSLLDPWSTSCLLCTLAIRVKVLGRAAYVTFSERQTMARETGCETSSTVCSLVWSQWQWASAGLLGSS